MGEAESLALWAVLFRDVGVAVLPIFFVCAYQYLSDL